MRKDKNLKNFTSDRKSKDDESVYTKLESVYKSFKLNRSGYHGGAFNGGHIKIYMKEAI